MKRTSKAVREAIATYGGDRNVIIQAALKLLIDQMASRTTYLTNPGMVRSYLQLQMAQLEHEEFWVVWLDTPGRVIQAGPVASGTIAETRVYTREVVKLALSLNAAGCVLAHNHPSGMVTPSRADEELTHTLVNAMKLIDVRVVDHFVVGSGDRMLSFREAGLM